VSDVYNLIPVKVVLKKSLECSLRCHELKQDVRDLGSQIEKVLTKENIKYTYLPNSDKLHTKIIHKLLIHSQYGIILFYMWILFKEYISNKPVRIEISIVGITTVGKLIDLIEFIKSILTKINIDYTDFEVSFEFGI